MSKTIAMFFAGLLVLTCSWRIANADKTTVCRSIKNRINYREHEGQTLSNFITKGQISPYQASVNLSLSIKILGKDSHVMLQNRLASIDSFELASATKKLPNWLFDGMKARGFQGNEPALRNVLIDYRNRLFADLIMRGNQSLANEISYNNLEQYMFRSELDFVRAAVAISTGLGVADLGCEKVLVYMFCR